jgi:uncharacterized protein involved in exopolysaccharide biosynthesis
MLQSHSLPQSASGFDEAQSASFDLSSLLQTFRRRIFYFAIPFVILLIVGVLITAIQRPIYLSEGRVLVESPKIPTTLVAPTVTAGPTERLQVIEQRLMSRDSLIPIVTKFNLFPLQREWMSSTQLLDLMRERSEISLVDLNSLIAGKNGQSLTLPQNGVAAIAFNVGFEYENPDLASKVANEFLTSILSEDVRGRTEHASETTGFLAEEVKRLQTKIDTINSQIFEVKRQQSKTQSEDQEVPEQLKVEMTQLADLKAQLIQQSSVHSEEYPAVKSLKKRVAALEQQIAKTPKPEQQSGPVTDKDIDALLAQQKSVEKDLDDANEKLTTARLGESMERNQESEHLQVIEQPIAPQKPVKPNRTKLLAFSFALSLVGGLAVVFLAEMLDKTIRGKKELIGILDSQILVTIPYIATEGELARNRRNVIIVWSALFLFLLAGIAAALYVGIAIDFSDWFDRSWIDRITRLGK